ncbi:fimbrial protein [Pseudomonas aeruginosa]|nr:fimbrial protein [Pseudomonas aeruginosa]
MQIKKTLLAITLVGTLAGSHLAFAAGACSWSSSNIPSSIAVPPLAASTSLSSAPIGQVMAQQSIQLTPWNYGFSCTDKWGMTLSVSGLEPSGIPNVYKTSVEGIGVRIGFDTPGSANWGGVKYPPFELPKASLSGFPRYLILDFIRTGYAVGKGPISFSFSSDFWGTDLAPTVSTVGTSLTTNLTNNVYFSACEAQVKSLTVPMGKVAAYNVRTGVTQAQNFDLSVYCKGWRPAQPAPVKIYFEGSTTTDGLLKFTGAGQSQVASGAAIELTDSNGARLPFTASKALNLDWQYSQPDAEVYHFSGKARYVPSGGEVRPGKADAVVSYVLVYN